MADEEQDQLPHAHILGTSSPHPHQQGQFYCAVSLIFFFSFLEDFIFQKYVYMCVGWVWAYACECKIHGGQKRPLDPLELES